MGVTLKDEKILQSWNTMIEDGQGKGAFIFDETKRLLEEFQPPDVMWKITEVAPGTFSGLFGKKRDYLMITNEALRDYKVYIGARDYGNVLDVSWYLAAEPGFFKKRLLGALAGMGADRMAASVVALDLFAQQDLHAYVSVVHSCVLKAVDLLMKELGQDFSKINRQSKGFLEVW
ncbi:MAG TPA: hypothetical protein VHT73_02445 [Thermodesulfobacteriota bacterium]|nr:hypothetical protein [Thermodesulfobacteriota bacterium]